MRNGKSQRREAFHWHKLARRVLQGNAISVQELSDIAIRYAAKNVSDLVSDPLPVAFDLKYTETSDARLLLNKIMAFADALVDQTIDRSDAGEETAATPPVDLVRARG